jgi:hypothetical protein
VFKQNAQEFYTSEIPIDHPVKIREEDLKDTRAPPPKSVLNDMRLKEHEYNMQRDPKFGKNLKKFWAQKSNSTVSGPQSFA